MATPITLQETAERLAWDEICRRYPNCWVVLANIDHVNDTDFDFRGAEVVATFERRKDASPTMKALLARSRRCVLLDWRDPRSDSATRPVKVTRFDTSRDLIIVPGRLWSPTGENVVDLRLVLDTGAAETIITNFRIHAQDLPAGWGIDGLIGLSFLRLFNYEVRSQEGRINVERVL